MLLNSQTLYHLNQKAAEEGVDMGEVVDRVVREWGGGARWAGVGI